MQTFQDTATGKIWSFEDNVTVAVSKSGARTFTGPDGAALSAPSTLTPYVVPTPSAADLLAAAQSAQIGVLTEAYDAAIFQPVNFTTAAKVAKTYQADASSQTILMQACQGYVMAGAVPTGFFWVASDNTQVAFTLDDLKGLYAAMLAQGWTAFQNLQAKKAAIRTAATIAAVQAVTW